MNRFKRYLLKWAIIKFAKAANHTYANLGWYYIEDIIENEMGERMFIFRHDLVPINQQGDRAALSPQKYSKLSDGTDAQPRGGVK